MTLKIRQLQQFHDCEPILQALARRRSAAAA
jgi:hypothetical protein